MHSNDHPLYFAVSPQGSCDPGFPILDSPNTFLKPFIPSAPTSNLNPLFVCGSPPVSSTSTEDWNTSRSRLGDPDLSHPGFTSTPSSPPSSDTMPTRKRRVSVQSILVLPAFLQGSSSTPTSPNQNHFDHAQSVKTRPKRDRAHSSATVSGTWSILRQGDDLALRSPLAPVSPSSSASIVTSPRDSPPPDFLLDDDPFANLTTGPTISSSTPPTPIALRHPAPCAASPPPAPPLDEPTKLPPTPRSPLMPTPTEVPPKSLVRANSGGEDKKLPVPPRVFPPVVAAHQRPAFSPRPSLPSLSTLAQMNVVLTKKVRKGRVGAGLPFEPWDNPTNETSPSPRVLQDVNGASTESLPTGTQPLLPSQLVGIATNASVRNEVVEGPPSHTAYTAPPPSASVVAREPFSTTHVPFPRGDEEHHHPQWAARNEEAHESQSTHWAFPSTSTSSDESVHAADSYCESYLNYSEGDDEEGEEEGDEGEGEGEDEGEEREGEERLPALALSLDDEARAMYQRYQEYAESDIEADTTTRSNSCDELSPPPSSRVSSFDLDPPHSLSMSISSSSSSSSCVLSVSESSSSRSSVGHEGEDGRLQVDFEPASRMSAVIALENQLRISLDSHSHENSSISSIGVSTRCCSSSMEDDESDSLHSPTTNQGFEEIPNPPRIVTSPESYTYNFPSLPKRAPTPGLTRGESFRSQSADLTATAEEQGQEQSARDMVARWRARYSNSRMGSFGAASGGSFLSDLELADEDEDEDGVEGKLAAEDTTSSSDEWFFGFEPSYPRALKAATASRLVGEESEGAWPSSADTVRPFSRYAASAPKVPFGFSPSTYDKGESVLGHNEDEDSAEEDEALGEDGDPVNSNGVDEFDGVAIGGVTSSSSVPWPRHSSALLDSAEDPFELGRRLAFASSFATTTTTLIDESASLSASTSTLDSARSTSSGSSVPSSTTTSTEEDCEDSDSESVYKDHLHGEECFDMLRYEAQWDGYGGNGAEEVSGQEGGYRGRSTGQQQQQQHQQDGGLGSGGGQGAGRYQATGAWGRSSGRGDDGDDEDERRRREVRRAVPESVVGVPSSGSGRDSEDDHPLARSLTVNYTSSTRQRPSHSHSQPQSHSQLSSPSHIPNPRSFPPSSAATSSDEDDDVPLAQRIPTALTAQKSIRRQVREERRQKRLERAATTASSSSSKHPPPNTTTTTSNAREQQQHNSDHDRDRRLGESTAGGRARERHETLRPAGAGGPAVPPALALSSSQEAALAAAAAGGVGALPSSASGERRVGRARANTLHSRPPVMATTTTGQEVFDVEELAVRLQSVQGLGGGEQYQPGLASTVPLAYGVRSAGARAEFENNNAELQQRAGTSLARGRTMKEQPSAPFPGASPTSAKQDIRRMRSFQRDVKGPPPPSAVAMEDMQRQQLSRSRSRVGKMEEEAAAAAGSSPRKRSASVSRAPSGLAGSHSYGVEGPLGMPPMPPLPSKMQWKASTTSGRTSMEAERGAALGRSPTVPAPAPAAPAPAPAPVSAPVGPVVQQRFFVGDMQRFNMVEIHSGTTAGEVVEMVEAQGGLKGVQGEGGWMVFEVAQDFGMERPIRSFELLSDVQASWNKDKMVNLFVLKLTPLAVPLNRNAIPSSSPIHSGYVDWEQKRGKWSKRFMQLREHSLWLSKREGKDQTLLCSLSNFDAYLTMTGRKTQKSAPKPFAFSVKSTDSLSFFENAADYVHCFACNEREGRVWVEKILVARSYVLQQERQVLFNPKAAGGNAAGGGGGAALSRAGTLARKPTTRRPVMPEAPLVSVPPLVFADQVPPSQPFQPGSLLHKQGMS